MRELEGEQLHSGGAQGARAAGFQPPGRPAVAKAMPATSVASGELVRLAHSNDSSEWAEKMGEKMGDREQEKSEWRPLQGPRRRNVQGHRDESLPRLSLQVWTWGLLRRMPRRLRELQEELALSTRGARRCIERLRKAGVGIDRTGRWEYELFYEVPLEVVLHRGKWCLSRPNQLGISVDELFTCDAQGRTVLRGPVPTTPSGFCLDGAGEHDPYRYADLYKEIYTRITATIIGAGGSKIWNRRRKEPEHLPEEHEGQWRPVWGPAKADVFEAPRSLAIWVWGLLRTMPRSAEELARELGISRAHAETVVSELRTRGILIQTRADGRYYMLDHSPIKIVWTRDGFRFARRGHDEGHSIDKLNI